MPEYTEPAELVDALLELGAVLPSLPDRHRSHALATYDRLVAVLAALFSPPASLAVTGAHRAAAIALVAAYLDTDDPARELFLATLSDTDRSGLGHPELRLSTLAALVQLAGDALVAAVAASASDAAIDAATDTDLAIGCRLLLQRLALARVDDAGSEQH